MRIDDAIIITVVATIVVTIVTAPLRQIRDDLQYIVQLLRNRQ